MATRVGVVGSDVLAVCVGVVGSGFLAARGGVVGSDFLSVRGGVVGSDVLATRGGVVGSDFLVARGGVVGSDVLATRGGVVGSDFPITFSHEVTGFTDILESIWGRDGCAAGLRNRLDSSGRGASFERVKEKAFFGTKGVLLLELRSATRNIHPTRQKAGSFGRALPSFLSHVQRVALPRIDSIALHSNKEITISCKKTA